MARNRFVSHKSSLYPKAWEPKVKRRRTKLRMLILYYQRLYLKFLVFKVANENPLLAIHISRMLSKPNTPPNINIIILYNRLKTNSTIKESKRNLLENLFYIKKYKCK